MKNPTFPELFHQASPSHEYRVGQATHAFTDEAVARLQASRMTRSDLATKFGSTPAYVTKLLSGTANLTIETMVKVAEALGCCLQIQLVKKESAHDWGRVASSLLPETPPAQTAWAKHYSTRNHAAVAESEPQNAVRDVYEFQQ